MPGGRGGLPRIRGLLKLYYALLVFFAVHNSALTVGSVMVYVHDSATGRSHVSLPSLIFYVVTNLALILYVIYLFRLMSHRRRSAIINNMVFNLLSVILLLSWHLIGEKSTTGTIADSAPSLVIVAYFLLSRRARRTFIIGRTTGQSADTPGRLSRDARDDSTAFGRPARSVAMTGTPRLGLSNKPMARNALVADWSIGSSLLSSAS
jgi:hypothetical protein